MKNTLYKPSKFRLTTDTILVIFCIFMALCSACYIAAILIELYK